MFETLFDSDDLPPEERLDRWNELTRRLLIPAVTSADSVAAFHVTVRIVDLGVVLAVHATSKPRRLELGNG